MYVCALDKSSIESAIVNSIFQFKYFCKFDSEDSEESDDSVYSIGLPAYSTWIFWSPDTLGFIEFCSKTFWPGRSVV